MDLDNNYSLGEWKWKDIVRIVFQQIEDLNTLKSCSIVCKLWFSIFRDDWIWKRQFERLFSNHYTAYELRQKEFLKCNYNASSWFEAFRRAWKPFSKEKRKDFMIPFTTMDRVFRESIQEYTVFPLQLDPKATFLLSEAAEQLVEQCFKEVTDAFGESVTEQQLLSILERKRNQANLGEFLYTVPLSDDEDDDWLPPTSEEELDDVDYRNEIMEEQLYENKFGDSDTDMDFFSLQTFPTICHLLHEDECSMDDAEDIRRLLEEEEMSEIDTCEMVLDARIKLEEMDSLRDFKPNFDQCRDRFGRSPFHLRGIPLDEPNDEWIFGEISPYEHLSGDPSASTIGEYFGSKHCDSNDTDHSGMTVAMNYYCTEYCYQNISGTMYHDRCVLKLSSPELVDKRGWTIFDYNPSLYFLDHYANSIQNFPFDLKMRMLVRLLLDENSINQLEIAKILLNSPEVASAAVKWIDDQCFGATLLHHAAIGGNIDVVDYLVSLGADISATDEDGRTPLDEARDGEREDLFDILTPRKKQIITQ